MFSCVFVVFTLIFPRNLFGHIDEYLNYHETLHHDSFKHHIVRRDLYTKDPTERLVEFDSHGRHFKLVLHKKTSIIADDFEVTFVNGRDSEFMRFDPAIYQGYVEDEPTTSSASAYWDDDANEFMASIETESDIFAIEPSWRHLPASSDYNLISYKASDMKQNKISKPQTCGIVAQKTNIKRDEKGRPTRNKRSSSAASSMPQKKFCQVRLVADHTFFKRIGGSSRGGTARYLVGLMDQVNRLFQSQTFGSCGKGFGFQIKNITILESSSHDHNGKKHYNDDISEPWESSEALLKAFTEKEGGDGYCLVHLFTATVFASQVLGVSYIGRPFDDSGGICAARKNTGWITFLGSDYRLVPSLQAMLVTAHEFGHNWGSPHDNPSDSSCAPHDLDGGKYLMFADYVSGIQRNNWHFSDCSTAAICEVLANKADVCFKETYPLTCLNYVLEEGEACDEGPVNLCCTENCTLERWAYCSDINHACCDNCQFANSSKICHKTNITSCMDSTNCTGNSLDCPIPEALPDGTYCETTVPGKCQNKTCISICELNNLTSCDCEAVDFSCKICCRNSSASANCSKFYDYSSSLMTVSDCTPCPLGVYFQGECRITTDATIERPLNGITSYFVSEFSVLGLIIVGVLLFITIGVNVALVIRRKTKVNRIESSSGGQYQDTKRTYDINTDREFSGHYEEIELENIGYQSLRTAHINQYIDIIDDYADIDSQLEDAVE